jgi:hypothetical protein
MKRKSEAKDAGDDLAGRGLFPPMPRPGGKVPRPKVVPRLAAPIPGEKLDGGRVLEQLGIPGKSSLILGRPSPEPFRIFRMLAGGRNALVLSGAHPERLRARFGLDEAGLVWLTAYTGSDEEALGPQTLEYELLVRATRHLRQNRGAILILDDMDYLASQRGFDGLARFLKSISDAAAQSHGTFLAVADPETFTERERAALLAMFDAVHPVGGEAGPAGSRAGTIPAPSTNCIVLGNSAGAYRMLENASRTRPALCITPHAPRKLKDRYDLTHVGFLWLSQSASGEGVLRPQELAFEGLRAVLGHLRSGEGALVFLDRLERLRPYAGFPEMVRFVKGVCDAAAELGGSALASLEPGSLEKREDAVLRKRFDAVLD